jgi:hypothetical protein
MERPDRRLLDGSVHPLGLAVGPRMIRLGEAVLDTVLCTHAIEDVRPEIRPGRASAIFWEVGEGDTVIGEHCVDRVREGADNQAQELGAIHLPGIVAELDVGKLRDTVYGEEHIEFAAAEAELTDIDMDVSDLGVRELALFGGSFVSVWQT